jgi:hypothetical protein
MMAVKLLASRRLLPVGRNGYSTIEGDEGDRKTGTALEVESLSPVNDGDEEFDEKSSMEMEREVKEEKEELLEHASLCMLDILPFLYTSRS